MKKNILQLNDMKISKEPVAWITAYDFPFAQCSEKAGIDMILVGDSGGMVQLGYKTTNPVTMDEMIFLSKSVRRGAPETFIIGDMPQGSYEISDKIAVRNALRFIKEAGCDAVKLEGGKRMASRVRAISEAGILVMGHLGLTPQSSGTFGGYKIQCKTSLSFTHTIDDAICLRDNGAFSILLEAMPSLPGKIIASTLNIPIYGIGAGTGVDGQLVIMHDLMGFYQPFRPWFAKCYIPEVIEKYKENLDGIEDLKDFGRKTRQDGLLNIAELAIRKYIEDVRQRHFPGERYSYSMTEEEENEIKQISKKWLI